MISWLTTVEPATAYVSSGFSQTNRSTSDDNSAWTAASSFSNWASANWSLTRWTTSYEAKYTITYWGTTYTGGPSSVTSSTTTTGDTSGTSSLSSSFLNTRSAETSTTASRAYTYQVTESKSVDTTVWTTVSTGFEELATTISQLIATSTASVSSSFATTTTSGAEADPGLYATVYQADGNEVIWAASASAGSTAIGSFKPASSVGASATRTTVMPNTVTTTLAQVDWSTITWDTTQPDIVSTYPHEVSTTMQATRTFVVGGEFTKLPAQTTTQTFAKETKTSSELTVTLVASSSFSPNTRTDNTYTVQTTDTVFSFYTVTSAASGLFTFGALSSSVGTTSSVIHTSSYANFLTDSTSEATPSQYYSARHSSLESITAYDTSKLGISSGMAGACANWVVAPSGVWGGSSVGVYYSASVSMSLMDEMSVKHSRGIVTAWPSVYLAERGRGSTTGTLTLSGLNATYRFGTDTSTRTMSLTQVGTPQTTTVASNSSVQGGVLGDLETKWEWTPAGAYRVYAGTGTSTMSTTGGWSSFSGSKTTRFLEPLSYIVTGTGDAIWTAQRNSTTYPAS